MMPTNVDWLFMVLRGLVCLSCTFMGTFLLVAFGRNHYLHRPKRWLVGWQGLFFFSVGIDAFIRMWARASFIVTSGTVQDVTTWPYWFAGIAMATGAIGTLFVWLRWPLSRIVGKGVKRKGEMP